MYERAEMQMFALVLGERGGSTCEAVRSLCHRARGQSPGRLFSVTLVQDAGGQPGHSVLPVHITCPTTTAP